MTQTRIQTLPKLLRLVLIAAILGMSAMVSDAQSTKSQSPPTSLDNRIDDNEPPPAMASMEAEMAAKRDIQSADKAHRENLARAQDLSFLSASIVSEFTQKKQLDPADLKRLEKVEKLAKAIRHAAGGSEDEVELEKPPAEVGAALTMLGEVSQSLKTKVEKTPKHVISAAVIDDANVLLELIKIVRSFPATANP